MFPGVCWPEQQSSASPSKAARHVYVPGALPLRASQSARAQNLTCFELISGVCLRMSGGRGVQSQTMKQGGDFQYPALTAGPCLCPGRHAGAKQPGCRYAGALATPRLCVQKLPTRVRMRDAGLILEIEREPLPLRDPCEQPSHVASGLGANPSDEHAAEHITELLSQSRDMHPNAVSLLFLKGEKTPLRQKNVRL